MGNWNISIKGQGSHHNNNPKYDADLATREFVEKLKAQGHTLTRAEFTLENAPSPQDDLLAEPAK